MEEGKVSKLESLWEKRSFSISLFMSIVAGVLYYYGFIAHFRNVLSDVIAFSSIVVGINGVFITLVISIKLTPAFKRLNSFLPKFEERLFRLLKTQVMVGITVVLLSIIITMLPASPSKILSVIGFVVWSFFFVLMSIGSYFSMNLIINIVVANNENPEVKKRE